MDERAQTLNDFALGVSVFLIAIVVSFTLLPSVFTPFTAPVRSDQTVQAERIGADLTDDLAEEANRLNDSATDAFFDQTTGDDLRDRYGLGPGTRVNVTLQIHAPDGSCGSPVAKCRSAGDAYGDAPVASAIRVVAGYDGVAGRCSPSCRVIVRVW
jgi:hypothetical protein